MFATCNAFLNLILKKNAASLSLKFHFMLLDAWGQFKNDEIKLLENCVKTWRLGWFFFPYRICLYAWLSTSFQPCVHQHAPTWVLTLHPQLEHSSMSGLIQAGHWMKSQRPLLDGAGTVHSLTVPAWLMTNIKNRITSRDSSQGHLMHEAVHARLNIMPTQTNHRVNEKEPQLYKLQHDYITQIQQNKSTSFRLIWPDLHTLMLFFLHVLVCITLPLMLL